MRKIRIIITSSCNTDNITIHCQLERPCHILAAATAERHIDHIHIHFDGIVDGKHNIRRRFEFSCLVGVALDHQQLHIRGDAGNTHIIHLGSNNTGHTGAVSVGILNDTHIILIHDFIVGSIVGLGADDAVAVSVKKLRVIRVNTGIDNGHRHLLTAGVFTPGQIPCPTDIQIIDIGLLGIHGVFHHIAGADLCIVRNVFVRSGEIIVVQGNFVMVLPVLIIFSNIGKCHALWKIDHSKLTIIRNPESSAELLCHNLRFATVRIGQNHPILIIVSRLSIQQSAEFLLGIIQRQFVPCKESAQQNNNHSDCSPRFLIQKPL